MGSSQHHTDHHPGDYQVLRSILEGTAAHTGKSFFRALVRELATALHTKGAWVTEYLEEKRRLRALAFWMSDHFVEEYEYAIRGTPCETVVQEQQFFHIPENIIELFPEDPDLEPFEAVSYLGAPLLDLDGSVLGHLAVQDIRPMPKNARNQALFRIFADRAASELRRIRAEQQLQEREEQLSRLVDSAMDAIIEIDPKLTIIQANNAAIQLLEEGERQKMIHQSFERYLSPEAAKKLKNLVAGLQQRPKEKRYLWVPGGFQAVRADGEMFQSEATLSCYEQDRNHFYTLILRNVSDRIEAEKRIDLLSAETEYLRQEIREMHNTDDIIGQSPAMTKVRDEIRQVADTDATVLIHGETGTGKELVARAIHEQSQRSTKPLIKVNCAAIPEMLIESEFFGHKKGAFTGATESRKGRFMLADGGTIFLDEIGELSPELQPKLLRVLQEGEFEPVGSSETRHVDVRVVAATNRNLKQRVENGLFREDLYYRL
ncbi:MAG: sigma 54-interacting transcriptional regulator, partial [Balneolaceae bacterium]|nr:sigma 54-interacting transcriptional regulator [Balneolaceae bacterium]